MAEGGGGGRAGRGVARVRVSLPPPFPSRRFAASARCRRAPGNSSGESPGGWRTATAAPRESPHAGRRGVRPWRGKGAGSGGCRSRRLALRRSGAAGFPREEFWKLRWPRSASLGSCASLGACRESPPRRWGRRGSCCCEGNEGKAPPVSPSRVLMPSVRCCFGRLQVEGGTELVRQRQSDRVRRKGSWGGGEEKSVGAFLQEREGQRAVLFPHLR